MSPSTAVGGKRQSYLPGLDGVRALAVIAVLIYHAQPRWLPAGFLGVDVFFVISGFIITRGLLAEWREHGRIDLKAFWLRRARRLLPAVYVLLVAVVAYSAALRSFDLAQLRIDVLAALSYVTNWRLILGDQSYFQSLGPPSPLRHLWSLAVEEQFYLIWPVLLSGGLMLRRPRALVPLIVAGAAASAVAMALLHRPDADASRIYYGTDTRATGLLVGAALAFFIVPSPSAEDLGWMRARALDIAAVAALAVLAWLAVSLDETSALLYQGGFAVAALATGVLIIAAVNHSAMVSKLLAVSPLRWLGVRSYGIYLWHWPVLLLTWPKAASPPLLLAELAATVVIAALSYRLVELPARQLRLDGAWQTLREWRDLGRWRQTAFLVSGAGAFSAVVSLGVVLATAQPAEEPAYLATKSVRIVNDGSTVSSSLLSPAPATSAFDALAGPAFEWAPYEPLAEAAPPAVEAWNEAPAAVGSNAAPAESPQTLLYPAPPVLPVPLPAVPGAYVTALGDSVMLGAAYQLAGIVPNIDLDAVVGRQVSQAIALLRERQESGALGDILLLDLGNNGTFTRAQFDEIMAIAGSERRVVFVNLKLPRPWEAPNNAVIADGVTRYPNAVLVDWHSATAERPDLFVGDFIHLRPEGAAYFAQLLARYVGVP